MFTVTIQPTDDGNVATGPETVLLVDEHGEIRELKINVNGGPFDSVPQFDWSSLAKAVASGSPPPAPAAAPRTRTPATGPRRPAATTEAPMRRPASRASRTPVEVEQAPPVEPPPAPSAMDKLAATAAHPESEWHSGGVVPVVAPAKRTRATKSLARKTAKPAAEQAGGRPYRRAPETADIVAVYRQASGSLSAMADHFEVPKHTINGWLRQIRAGKKGDEYARQLDGDPVAD